MKKRIVALFLMMILVTVSSVSMASTVMLRANGKNSVTVSISASGGYITASARATINVGSNPSVVVVLEKKMQMEIGHKWAQEVEQKKPRHV